MFKIAQHFCKQHCLITKTETMLSSLLKSNRMSRKSEDSTLSIDTIHKATESESKPKSGKRLVDQCRTESCLRVLKGPKIMKKTNKRFREPYPDIFCFHSGQETLKSLSSKNLNKFKLKLTRLQIQCMPENVSLHYQNKLKE